MKTIMGLMLLGLMLTGCDNIAPELLPALPGDGADTPVFVADRPYVRVYLVSAKPRVTLGREKKLEAKAAQIRTLLLEVQELFASELDRHGHGRMTFPIALDAAGRVHGTHITLPEERQFYVDGTLQELKTAFYEAYHAREPAPGEIPFFFVEPKMEDFCGESSFVTFVFMKCRYWKTVAHEIGHQFGLPHDWRNGEYLMSYGETLEPDGTWTPVASPDKKSKLSRGAAAWLSHSPTFNGRRVSPTQVYYYWILIDLERDMAPVEGNSEGLHQFQIRFSVAFNKSDLSDPIGPLPAPELNETGFAIARLIENTASEVENFRGGNVVRYLDKDDLQFTLHKEGTSPGAHGTRGDYLHYDLRFKAHLSADVEVVYLDLLMPTAGRQRFASALRGKTHEDKTQADYADLHPMQRRGNRV